MTSLAGFSGQEVMKKLKRIGYVAVRQKGSHVRIVHDDKFRRRITLPMHKEIGVGLLKQILKDVGLDQETFLDL